MNETTANYPEWQKLIREAQAQQAVIKAQEEAAEIEKKAQIDVEHGRNLARVLDVVFGIKVEQPTRNEIEVGDYYFHLKTYRSSSDWDDRLPLFSEKTGQPPFIPTITFTVYVGIKRPEYMNDWENWPNSLDRSFSTTNSPINADWLIMRAQLANSLDSLKSDADVQLQAYADRQKRVFNTPTKELSVDELINRKVIKAVEKATEHLHEDDY